MQALGIETGADLRAWSLDALTARFGKAGGWYYAVARGEDHRPVNPTRERKSSGSETTFGEDLMDPDRIEAGVLAMVHDVWNWCERTGRCERCVTVKIKWADFTQCTRSRSYPGPVESLQELQTASLALVRSVFPPAKGVRLVGVAVSNFIAETAGVDAPPDLLAMADAVA